MLKLQKTKIEFSICGRTKLFLLASVNATSGEFRTLSTQYKFSVGDILPLYWRRVDQPVTTPLRLRSISEHVLDLEAISDV